MRVSCLLVASLVVLGLSEGRWMGGWVDGEECLKDFMLTNGC